MAESRYALVMRGASGHRERSRRPRAAERLPALVAVVALVALATVGVAGRATAGDPVDSAIAPGGTPVGTAVAATDDAAPIDAVDLDGALASGNLREVERH